MAFGDAFADAFSSSYRTSSNQMFDLLREKREQDRKARAVAAIGELKDIANASDEINQAGGEAVVDQMPGAAISGKKFGITEDPVAVGGITPTQLIEERATQLAQADPSIAPEMYELLTNPRSWIQTHKQETLDYQSANAYVNALSERYGDDPFVVGELSLINAIKNPTLKLQSALTLGAELNDPEAELYKYNSEYSKQLRTLQDNAEVAKDRRLKENTLWMNKTIIGYQWAVASGEKTAESFKATYNRNYEAQLGMIGEELKTLNADNATLIASAENGGWNNPNNVAQTFEYNDTTYSLTWKEAAAIYALSKDGQPHWAKEDLKLLGLQPNASLETYLNAKYGFSESEAKAFARKITNRETLKSPDYKAHLKYSAKKEALEMERALQVQINKEANMKMVELEAQHFSKDADAAIQDSKTLSQRLDIIHSDVEAMFAKAEGLAAVDVEELRERKQNMFNTISANPKEADNFLRNEEASTIQAYANLVSDYERELKQTAGKVKQFGDTKAGTTEQVQLLEKKVNVAKKMLNVAIETATADTSQPWLGRIYDSETIEALVDAKVNLATFENAHIAIIFTTLEETRKRLGPKATADDYIKTLEIPELADIFEGAEVDTTAFREVLGKWYSNLSEEQIEKHWGFFNTLYKMQYDPRSAQERSYQERLKER